jgi:hypothetical protein
LRAVEVRAATREPSFLNRTDRTQQIRITAPFLSEVSECVLHSAYRAARREFGEAYFQASI